MKISLPESLGRAALGMLIAAAPLRAQVPGLRLSVAPSAISVAAGDSITYTLEVTNLTGLRLGDAFVTNDFSTAFTIQGVSFTRGNGVNYTGSVLTNNVTVVLDLKQFNPANLGPGSAQATITVIPAAGSFNTNGFFTNAVVAIAPEVQSSPNSASTNVVVEITNVVVQADLGLFVSGFGQGILAGDIIAYTAIVTNRGPDMASDVFLTNTLPPGTTLISVLPTNLRSALTNDVLVLSLGSLSNASVSAVTLVLQPTNAGLLTFAVSAGAPELEDPNLADNAFQTNLDVGSVIRGQVIATNVSAMTLDPQTGLMDQTVRLVNVSTSVLASVRLTVSGLTNWLYNAVGTNAGQPFAVYPSTLNPGQSVDLALEFFVPTRLPIQVDNSNYTALGVPAFDLTAPDGTNGLFSITRTVLLPDGNLLIEFPSVLGASYSILYSTNTDFTHALIAQPNIIAPADRVQWIDDGPPKTVRPPASEASRFYRVFRN